LTSTTDFVAFVLNKSATAGLSVTLTCNSSGVYPVNWWYHEDQSDTDETEVVVNGEILDENSFRMTLIGNDLVIHKVLPSDTGIYTCVDNTGFGEQHKISLTVSGFMFFCFIFHFCQIFATSLENCLDRHSTFW